MSSVVVCVDGEDLAKQGPCPADQHMAVTEANLAPEMAPAEFMYVVAAFFGLIVFMYVLGLALGFVKRNL